jgi:hypothetical protein
MAGFSARFVGGDETPGRLTIRFGRSINPCGAGF